jgi:hypothetical protein
MMLDVIIYAFAMGLVMSSTFGVIGLLVRYGKGLFNTFGR